MKSGTVLTLTTVYFVSKVHVHVHCTLNVGLCTITVHVLWMWVYVLSLYMYLHWLQCTCTLWVKYTVLRMCMMYVHSVLYFNIQIWLHCMLFTSIQDPVDSSEVLSKYCNDLIHGQGYKFWFDKSFSTLFYKNAVVSYNYNHETKFTKKGPCLEK